MSPTYKVQETFCRIFPHTVPSLGESSVEGENAVALLIYYIDLARMGNRNTVWKVKIAGAAAVATSLIEKRDLRGHRVDQLRL